MMYRIQFPTFEDYENFINNLPDDTDFDESSNSVKTGNFSYLMVQVPGAKGRIAIDRPPRSLNQQHKLLSKDITINYECVCGQEDSFTLHDGHDKSSHHGCCENTVYAYRMSNGEIELDNHER